MQLFPQKEAREKYITSRPPLFFPLSCVLNFIVASILIRLHRPRKRITLVSRVWYNLNMLTIANVRGPSNAVLPAIRLRRNYLWKLGMKYKCGVHLQSTGLPSSASYHPEADSGLLRRLKFIKHTAALLPQSNRFEVCQSIAERRYNAKIQVCQN